MVLIHMAKKKRKGRKGSKMGGTYVGLMNGMPRSKRGKVKKIKATKGMRAAVVYMRKQRKRL